MVVMLKKERYQDYQYDYSINTIQSSKSIKLFYVIHINITLKKLHKNLERKIHCSIQFPMIEKCIISTA